MESIYANFKLNFLYVDKYTFSEEWAYPREITPYCMYRYILEGKALFMINGREFLVKKDDVFYIPQGCTLECRALDAIEFISIRFVEPVKVQGSNMLKELFHISYLNRCNDPEVREYFNQIYLSAISKNKSKMFKVRGYLDLITAKLAEHSGFDNYDAEEVEQREIQDLTDLSVIRRRAQKSVLHTDPRITMVVDYLVTHPTENLSIAQMCEMAEMSESSLRRLFKKQTGKTPNEFTKELKMVTAARRLLISDERISAIAYSIGYDTANYFSRCFKEIFGISPREYRRKSHGL